MQPLNDHELNWFKNTVINNWGFSYCKSLKYRKINAISLNFVPHSLIKKELNNYIKLFCQLK